MEEIPFSISSKPSNSQSPYLPVKKDCFFEDRRTCFSQTPPRSPHVLLPFSPSGLILVSLVWLVWGGSSDLFLKCITAVCLEFLVIIFSVVGLRGRPLCGSKSVTAEVTGINLPCSVLSIWCGTLISQAELRTQSEKFLSTAGPRQNERTDKVCLVLLSNL